MRLPTTPLVIAFLITPGLWACRGDPPNDTVVQRTIIAEPAAPMDVPIGAQLLKISGTTNNKQPILPTDPTFRPELCDELRAAQPVILGETRAQLTSDAALQGNQIGEATMHAEACLFGPPPTVVAALTITASDGDTLYLNIRGTRTADSPPPPGSEDRGTGTVAGGTGRFAGATGEFNLSAKSHGDLLPGTNVATQRDIDINGYIYLPASNVP